MDEASAIAALAALSQPTRLTVFRLLVRHEPDGMPAGEIARRIEVPHNTLSTHLAVLARAGLVGSRRDSRHIIYRARLECMREMLAFLVEDCCGGDADACGRWPAVLAGGDGA